MSDEIIDPCRFTWRTDRDARGRGPWCLAHRDYAQSWREECRVAVLMRERDEARRFADAMRRYAMAVLRGGLELQDANKTLQAQIKSVQDVCERPDASWFEWLMPGVATTHAAYVHEGGWIYVPDGESDDNFLLASAEGRAYRLIRADQILHILRGEREL